MARPLHIVVEMEGSDERLVPVDAAASVTVEAVVAAAHEELALPLPLEAYTVVGMDGKALPHTALLDAADAPEQMRVGLVVQAKWAARAVLSGRGVTGEEAVLSAFAEACRRRNEELLRCILVAEVVPAATVSEECSAAARWSELDLLDLLVTCSPAGVAAAGELALVTCAHDAKWEAYSFLQSKGAVFSRPQHRDIALLLALSSHAWEVATALLEGGADANATRPLAGGMTCLTAAAEGGAWDVVAALLAHGAHVNKRDFFGRTAVTIAAEKNLWGQLVALIDAGGDPHSALSKGPLTPVILAAGAGALDVVRAVAVKDGAALNAERRARCVVAAAAEGRRAVVEYFASELGCDEDALGKALGAAVKGGHTEVVSCLLDCGVAPDAVFYGGESALSLAVKADAAAVVLLLLRSGAAPDRRNSEGLAPVLLAAGPPLQRDVLEALAAHGAGLGVTGKDGRGAVAAAAERGAWDDAAFLVTLGCPGDGAAVSAAQAGAWGPLVAMLTPTGCSGAHEAGAPPAACLEAAVQHGAPHAVVAALVDLGCAPHSHPVICAGRSGRWDDVALFAARGASRDALGACLVHAACAGEWGLAGRLLLEHGADPTVVPDAGAGIGDTYAHVAARMGHVPALRSLKECPCGHAALQGRNGAGRTPLLEAAKHGSWEAVALLLERPCESQEDPAPPPPPPCDVGAADIDGRTALHYAARGGDAAAVGLLLDCGAALDAVDGRQGTAALEAARAGHWALVEHLVRSGADAEVEDAAGESCLTAAADHGCLTEFARFLVDAPPPARPHC